MPPRLACAAGAALRRTAAAYHLPPWTRNVLLPSVAPATGHAVPGAYSSSQPLQSGRDVAREKRERVLPASQRERVLPASHAMSSWLQAEGWQSAKRLQLVACQATGGGRGRFFSMQTGGDGGGGRRDERTGGRGWRSSQWWERKFKGGEGSKAGAGARSGGQGTWGVPNSLAATFAGCLAVAGSAAALDRLIGLQDGRDAQVSLLLGALLARCERLPFADSRKIEDYYEIMEELGAGIHASVKRGRNKKTKELVAVKCIDKDNMKPKQLDREIQILSSLSHPNVISLKDVFEDVKYVYLVLELVEGGELFDKIVKDGAFSEKDAAKLIRKITEALQYLHEKKVCHRDLKPENLLLTSRGNDADVKIADFGLSKLMGEKSMMKRACGTWAYWAPEILRRQPYDTSVDLWSVGVILYIMLSGVHPFDPDGQSSDAQIVERILKADYKFDPEYWSGISPAARHVVQSLIHMDPMQRLTCKELLQHPWVAGTNVSNSPLPSTALDNLQNFTVQNRKQFGQGLVGIVASQALMRKVNRSQLFDSEIEEMRNVFMAHSADSRQEMEKCAEETEGNCSLPALKLGATMRALGQNISDRDAMRLALNSSIIDSQGRIPFSMFVTIMAHEVEGRETEEDLKRAFTYLDTSNKGHVSVSDIQRALALMGVRMTEEHVREMVKEVDTSNRGRISFSQFQQLFRNVNGR